MILLRIFKNSRTVGQTGVVVLAIALFVRTMISAWEPAVTAALTEYTGMPFYNMLLGALHKQHLLNHILALALVLVISYLLIRMGGRFVLLEFRSVMPGFFFLLFAVALPSTQQVSPALVGSIFYLICFTILFDAHDKPPDTFQVLAASLVLALGSMFYMKLIWFLPLIWISLGTLRTVTWRELLYPVAAYVLLGLSLVTWTWVVQDDASKFSSLLRENLAFRGGPAPNHFSIYIYYGYFLLLVLVASAYMVNRFQARKTVIQNIYQVMFYMFIAGILFFIFVARFDPTALVYIAFPITFVLSNFFHQRRNRWMHELALWILLGLLVFAQIMV